jgi:hypothetical protein
MAETVQAHRPYDPVMDDDAASANPADAVSVARGLKLVLVSNPERDNDVYPTLVAFRRGEIVAICDLRESWSDRKNVLREVVAVLAPDEVALVREGVISLAPQAMAVDGAPLERRGDGDLTVGEAIDVLQVTSTGAASRLFLPYTLVDGALTWHDQQVRPVGEPETPPEARDDVVEALQAGFDGGSPGNAERARALLEPLGVRVRFAADPDPFAGVGPDDPCPCGSDRKLRDCHYAYRRSVPQGD